MKIKRPLKFVGRGLEALSEETLVSAPFNQFGMDFGGEVAGEPQDPRVLRSRLAVSPESRRARRRGRSKPQDRLSIACRLSVMGQPGGIGIRGTGELDQDTSVELRVPRSRSGGLYGKAGQLMPERNGIAIGLKDPRGEALSESSVGFAGQCLQE